MTLKTANSQWTADHLTIQKCETKQNESPTITFVWTFNLSTGVLIFHHRIVKFPNGYYRMEKDTEWRRKTENKCFIGKTLTKRRNPRKGNGSTQWKRKRD